MRPVLARALVIGGLLIAAFGYCPPGAEAAPLSKAAPCCRLPSHGKRCPAKPKDRTSRQACCAPAGAPATLDHAALTPAPLVAQRLSPVAAAPQVQAQRLVRSVIRPIGPPGWSPASSGNRAPPLA